MKNRKPQVLHHMIAIIIVALSLAPLLIIVAASFTNEYALNDNGYKFWITELDLTAYRYIFKNPMIIIRSYGVTILATAATTVFGVLFMSMLAYTLARKSCSFRRPLAFYVFFTMLFSGGLVPSYILITQYLHLKDNLLVLILPSLINPFYVIMLRTFIQKLPASLFESAKIDGASEFRIFVKIAMPLSVPVLATVSFFTAMIKWNDWYSGLLYISNDKLEPLQYMLYRIQNNLRSLLIAMTNAPSISIDPADIPGQNLIMAMAVVAVGPMLVIFPMFQKYFREGLTVGAVKE